VILATRKDLEQLLQDDQDSLLLHGWRYSMVGKELQQLLLGKLSLSINEQCLTLHTIE